MEVGDGSIQKGGEAREREKYNEHPYTFHSGSSVIKNLPLLFSLSLSLICNSTLVL